MPFLRWQRMVVFLVCSFPFFFRIVLSNQLLASLRLLLYSKIFVVQKITFFVFSIVYNTKFSVVIILYKIFVKSKTSFFRFHTYKTIDLILMQTRQVAIALPSACLNKICIKYLHFFYKYSHSLFYSLILFSTLSYN